jgi:hypothetical protein
MICVVIVERGGDDETSLQQDVAAAVQQLDADNVFVARPTAILTYSVLTRLYNSWHSAKHGAEEGQA